MDESAAELGNAFALAIDEVSDEITTLRHRELAQLAVSFAILLLAIVVGGLLSRRVYRSITSPLKSLEEAATRLGQDDLSHRIDVRGDDELARVGSAFNSMAERLQQSRDELSHLALHDQLTGLPNRALFIEQLGHAVARSRRRGSPVSVLFLDLDGFKAVNDTFGHEAGDEVLVGVADRLRRALRDEDMIARLGGDEFGIILEEELQGATLTAERIIRRFEKPWSSSSGISPVGVSIGISSRTGDEEVDELLRQSDIAMYAAKAAGKGRWRVFSPDLGGELRAVQSLRTELQHAVEAEEFAVHYQPVMNLGNGSIVGVEALVRWNHPERGLLAPSEFLEEAEASGHIIHIDRWVLREACRQVREWQRHVSGAESLSVHVNLSARQLQHPGLAEEIAEAVRVSGLAPNDLILEITETTLVRDAEAAASELRKLKELGVRLALDDFGTGYSSLSHLHEFPIDIIKIDRSFVSAIGDGSKRSELVRALVSLGTTLGLVVVAEGIEDASAARVPPVHRLRAGSGVLLREAARTRPARDAAAAGLPQRARPGAGSRFLAESGRATSEHHPAASRRSCRTISPRARIDASVMGSRTRINSSAPASPISCRPAAIWSSDPSRGVIPSTLRSCSSPRRTRTHALRSIDAGSRPACRHASSISRCLAWNPSAVLPYQSNHVFQLVHVGEGCGQDALARGTHHEWRAPRRAGEEHGLVHVMEPCRRR